MRFKVSENDQYREARAFREEIVDRLNEYSGITFFAHNKGVSNVLNPNFDNVSIKRWIASMYYLNLEEDILKEAEEELVGAFASPFFGAYCIKSEKIENKYKQWYAGTFYWTNTNRLYNDIVQRGLPIPNLHDRGYAEFFPGEMEKTLCTHNKVYLYPFDYNDVTEALEFLLQGNEEELKKYYEYEKALDI